MRTKRTGFVLALIMLLASPPAADLIGLFQGTALAQDRDEKPTTLDPMTVTAPKIETHVTSGTKTDTPILEIPASIQAIPAERLEAQGGYSINSVLRNVSGVEQEAGSNYGFFNIFSIRGLQQKFYRDGIPDGASINGYARTLTDVERIEILKGPASALYGGSQPGGIVNLVSKQPLDVARYKIYQEFGTFSTSRTGIDFGGPLGSSKFLYRFNAAYYTSDGFRDLENDTIEFLPIFTWNPNNRHSITLDIDYRDVKIIADSAGIPFQGSAPLNVSLSTKYYTPFSDTDQEVLRIALHHEYQMSDALLIRNNLSVLRRDLFVRRNAGGRLKDDPATGRTLLSGRRLREQTDDITDIVYQLEPVWEFKSGSTEHTVLGGFEYQRQDHDAVRNRASLPDILDVFNPVVPETSRNGLTFNPKFDRKIESEQFAFYLQDQISFGEKWKTRLGVRLDQFDLDDVEKVKSRDVSRSDNEIGANVGLVYQPVKTTSFYASYSRSHFATFSSEGTGLPPETATQFEVGNKTTFLDGRVSATIAFFHLKREDSLIRVAPFFDFETSIPVGEQETKGSEFDFVAQPVPGWDLSANYTFNDSELTKLDANNKASEGNRPRGNPENSAAFWTTYTFQDGALQGFGFGGGVTYKGKVFNDTKNIQKISSYTLIDLAAFYRWKSIEAQLNVNNVTDKDYFRNGLFGSATPGEPVTVSGKVTVSF